MNILLDSSFFKQRDFTYAIFLEILEEFIAAGFHITSFGKYLETKPEKRILILKHDVDRKPNNALAMAKLENQLNVQASYYFRVVPESFDKSIIEQIIALGHEIGYHYEDLALSKGNFQQAYQSYQKNLSLFQQYYPVKTICMHGSPLSKWSNRALWDKYDFKIQGVVGDPFIDIDYQQFMYLTDTGRTWKNSASLRDNVGNPIHHYFKSTSSIIEAVQAGRFQDKVVINIHPERWNDAFYPWVSQLIGQNVRNIGKYFLKYLRFRE